MRVAWTARFPPLAATLVVARGAAARALARRLLGWPDERLARLRGGAAEGLLVVAGPEHELPWVDGAVYLGVDEEAPRLRLPTALAPSCPPDLLEQLLLGAGAGATGPLAVLPDADGDGDGDDAGAGAARLVTIACGALGRIAREALAGQGAAP